MCGHCAVNAVQTGFLPPECCVDHIITQKSCALSSAPCWIDVRQLSMVPARLMPLVKEHMGGAQPMLPAAAQSHHGAAAAAERPAGLGATSKLAFVVWASQPEVDTKAVRRPPRRTAMQKVANRDVRGFRWEIAPEAVSRRPPISLSITVACTEGFTFTAEVWALSIVQGAFSVAPCQTLGVTIRNLFIAVQPWDLLWRPSHAG
jgi:hypothetical protein